MEAFSTGKLLQPRPQVIPTCKVLSKMSSSKLKTRKQAPLMRVRGENKTELDQQIFHLLEPLPHDDKCSQKYNKILKYDLGVRDSFKIEFL